MENKKEANIQFKETIKNIKRDLMGV